MAPGWQEIAAQHVELLTGHVRESLSSGLVFLKSELGLDLGLNPDLCAPWLLLVTASCGLVLLLGLLLSVCRGVSKGNPTTDVSDAAPAAKTDEPKKRSRKRNAEKKAQRNGLAVKSQNDVKVNEPSGPPDVATEFKKSQRNGLAVKPQKDVKVKDPSGPPEVKADAKGKKNKKKAKVSVTEKKYSKSADGKEPDEGTWETKVSNREKRQQRRKSPDEESGCPVPTELLVSASEPVHNQPEPEPIITAKSSEPFEQRNVEVVAAKTEAGFEQDFLISQANAYWDEVLALSEPEWSDLGLRIPPQSANVHVESWTSMSLPPQPFTVAQDMEGFVYMPTLSRSYYQDSWTIVDGSQIPGSIMGLGLGMLDDEWSGINRACADMGSDWSAPSEEWGNCVAQRLLSAAPQEEEQAQHEPMRREESDNEKEEAAAAGDRKAKKRRKKKKVEEAAPIPLAVKEKRDTKNETRVDSACAAPAPVQTRQNPTTPEPTERFTPLATHKISDDLESPKPVKKKKARRET